MITVHLRYEIDPDKLDDFTEYGRTWIRLVAKHGGTHHGYFLPSEGDSDEAFALFTFPSLAAYEVYRTASRTDPECVDAFEFARRTKCIRRYERRFLSPVFEPQNRRIADHDAARADVTAERLRGLLVDFDEQVTSFS